MEVPPPKTKPKPVPQTDPVEEEAGGGYTLSDPYELETIDTTVDMSLGEIDYDDDEFFEKKRQLEAGLSPSNAASDDDEEVLSIEEAVEPGSEIEVSRAKDTGAEGIGGRGQAKKPVNEESKASTSAADDDDEYNLLPVADDIAEAKPTSEGFFGGSTNISDPISVEPEAEADPPQKRTPQKRTPQKRTSGQPRPAATSKPDIDEPVKVDAASSSNKQGESTASKTNREDQPESSLGVSADIVSDGLDYAGVFSNLGKWIKYALRPLRNINGIIRWGMISLMVGGCYLIMAKGAAYFTPEFNTAEKFWGFALICFGSVPLAGVLFFLGVIGNSTTRIAIEKRGSLDEWPDFSLPDWFGQFIYLGTSFWIAAIPGAIFGSLMMFVTESSMWLYSMILISALIFAPFFLASVVYNESPWSLISTEVFQSLKPLKNRWTRFLIAAFFIGLVMALGGFLIPFGLTCFLVDELQSECGSFTRRNTWRPVIGWARGNRYVTRG